MSGLQHRGIKVGNVLIDFPNFCEEYNIDVLVINIHIFF